MASSRYGFSDQYMKTRRTRLHEAPNKMRCEDSSNDTKRHCQNDKSAPITVVSGALRAYMRIGATARYARHRVLTCTRRWVSTCSRALVAPEGCVFHCTHEYAPGTCSRKLIPRLHGHAQECASTRRLYAFAHSLGRRRNAWMRRLHLRMSIRSCIHHIHGGCHLK